MALTRACAARSFGRPRQVSAVENGGGRLDGNAVGMVMGLRGVFILGVRVGVFDVSSSWFAEAVEPRRQRGRNGGGVVRAADRVESR